MAEAQSDFAMFLHKISKVKVADSSLSQLLGNEILEAIKSAVGCLSPCPHESCLQECQCCLRLKTVLNDIQTKIMINDGNRQEDIRENEARDNLSCHVPMSTTTKRKTHIPGNTGIPSKTPRVSKLLKKSQTVSGKKGKRARDETEEVASSSSRPARSCTKNISYSSKIPCIESPDDFKNIKKSSLHVPKKLSFGDNHVPGGSTDPPNPGKKSYQNENIPEHGLRQVGSTSGKKVSTTLSSSQSASACMKNISYGSKILNIESIIRDLHKKKKSSLHVPVLNCDSIPGSSKPPNPVKKLYQKENIPEHGLCQVCSKSGKEVSTTLRFYNW